MATVDQRVSYIEGRLDSLATKADLANLRTELSTKIDTKIDAVLWKLVGTSVAVGALIVGALRLWQ